MIQTIVNFLLDLVRTVWYPGVALAMFIESFFAPIPSEAIMPMAGWLAAQGTMQIWILAVVGWVASYLGTLPFYFLGYWGNREKINGRLAKYGKRFFIKPSEVDTAFSWFEKRGKGFVFFGRLVPIVRTVISFPAGCVKMPFVPFSVLTLLGSTLWSGILATAGYYLGENRSKVGAFFGQYEHVVLAALGICAVAYVYYLFAGRQKKA
jgi:membrane protein DedA with SNARE-associated domain